MLAAVTVIFLLPAVPVGPPVLAVVAVMVHADLAAAAVVTGLVAPMVSMVPAVLEVSATAAVVTDIVMVTVNVRAVGALPVGAVVSAVRFVAPIISDRAGTRGHG